MAMPMEAIYIMAKKEGTQLWKKENTLCISWPCSSL